jgi:hypothetical protein
MPGRSRQVSLSALAARTTLPDTDPDGPATLEVASTTTPGPTDSNPNRAATPPQELPTPVAPPASPPPTARRPPRRKATRPAPGEWARFDQYERKEARLRPDQYGRLSTTSRELNRARHGTGERITENTLIRVAIDLLLERGDDLTGTTESELRKSVGL